MPATRIVIDMQPQFGSSLKPSVLVGVTKEIVEAKRQGAPIVVVEYQYYGSTHESLLQLLRGYKHVARITKNSDDGSFEVVRTLKRRGFSQHTLRVCGVNSDACVESTVRGLVRRLPKAKINVVKSGCEWSLDRPYNWSMFYWHENVRLV